MKTQILSLALSALLVGCMRGRCPPPVPRENDTSIVVPRFLQSAIEVGAGEQAYELEGAVLRALMIAANDHRPPGDGGLPCMYRQERQRYRVIRQDDIIFVGIEEDPEACGLQYIPMHSGVTYAISVDGRILRRVTASSLEGMTDLESLREAPRPPAPPAPSAGVEAPESEPPPGAPSEGQGGEMGPSPAAPPPVPTPSPEGGP